MQAAQAALAALFLSATQPALADDDLPQTSGSVPDQGRARVVVSHIFRAQDLVDGFLSRIAPKLDSAFEASSPASAAVPLRSAFEIDLAPALPPGGGPGGVPGLPPSPLAALVATTGRLGVAYAGSVVSNASGKSGRVNVVLTANTDVVLTDAADSKTLSLKKGAQIRYAFIWSRASDGRRTYASSGDVVRAPISVARLGQTGALEFSAHFDVAVAGADPRDSSVRVAFDDVSVWRQGPVAAPALYETAFVIEDLPSGAGTMRRALRAASYAVNGVGLNFDYPASEI